MRRVKSVEHFVKTNLLNALNCFHLKQLHLVNRKFF